jgi:hypothetical protein
LGEKGLKFVRLFLDFSPLKFTPAWLLTAIAAESIAPKADFLLALPET